MNIKPERFCRFLPSSFAEHEAKAAAQTGKGQVETMSIATIHANSRSLTSTVDDNEHEICLGKYTSHEAEEDARSKSLQMT